MKPEDFPQEKATSGEPGIALMLYIGSVIALLNLIVCSDLAKRIKKNIFQKRRTK
jgi:hypothetical protein